MVRRLRQGEGRQPADNDRPDLVIPDGDLTATVRYKVRLPQFYIDAPLHEGLKAIKERDGVSEAEQMRRGIKLYLESKGYTVKKPTKKAKKGARKR